MEAREPLSIVFFPFSGCFSDALPDRWGRTLLKRRYSSGGWSDLQKIFKVDHKSPFTESGLC